MHIIEFNKDATEDQIANYVAKNKLKVVRNLVKLGRILIVESETLPADHKIIDLKRSDSTSLELLANRTVVTSSEDQWWKVAVLREVDLDAEKCEIIDAGKGVRVYLVDSGYTADHPDFKDRDISELYSFNENFSDSTGHGTALASVIVGNTCGISDASLKIVKVFEKDTDILVSDVLGAFEAILVDFEKNPLKAAVVNLSWTVGKDDYLNGKIQVLMDAGLFVVAAAGNSGVAISDTTPAGIADVITVGSFGQELSPSDFTDYTAAAISLTRQQTNGGPGLDIFAPGEGIRVALPDGSYGLTAGTSVAAAIMSACSAINIASLNWNYDYHDAKELREHLVDTYVSTGLLTLDGRYSASRNAIPSVRLRTPESDDLVKFRASVYFQSGEEGRAWFFNPNFFSSAEIIDAPAWLEVKDNFVCSHSPQLVSAGGFDRFDFDVILTRVDGTTIKTRYTVGVLDVKSYKDDAELSRRLSMELLNYGCASCGSKWCCGSCKNSKCTDACLASGASCP